MSILTTSFCIIYDNPSEPKYPVISMKIPHNKMSDNSIIIKSRYRIEIIFFSAITIIIEILLIHNIF